MSARVRVVDDEVVLAEVGAQLLDGGYLVERAHDGDLAIEKLRGFGADRVLTNLRMPGPDGWALLRAVVRERGATRAVVMTGGLLDGDAAKLVDLGVYGWLAKPIDVETLTSTVARCLADPEGSCGVRAGRPPTVWP